MPKVKIDFSEASAGGQFRERNVEEGDYRFVIKSSEEKTSAAGAQMIVFTVTSPQIAGGKYPIYCPLSGKGAFKIRELMSACGVSTNGKSAILFDTDKLHGKEFAATVVDDEHNGNIKSKIETMFPISELEDTGVPTAAPRDAAPLSARDASVEDTDDGSAEIELDEI